MTTTKHQLISDDQRLVGAKTRFGHDIPVYDDGYGPLWIHRDSMGISGIVRAAKWHEAYEICEDEFFPEADETVEEMKADHQTIYKSGRELWDHKNPDRLFHTLTRSEQDMACKEPGYDVPYDDEWHTHPCWCEAYGFRPNGPNSRDKIKHGIYAKDLNGDRLDPLSEELAKELEITVELEDEGVTQ